VRRLHQPGRRLSESDWLRNNQRLAATARTPAAGLGRHPPGGAVLRNETRCRTSWDESDSSHRLSDRAQEVARWKEALERCTQEVEEEMAALSLAQEQMEQALAATSTPLEVSRECLTLREGRRDGELVEDLVDEELRKEVQLSQRAQEALQEHMHSFEQMCVLQESRQRLCADLRDKAEALEVERSCLRLTPESPLISLKTEPTRIPAGSSTPEEWLRFSRGQRAAQKARLASRRLREEASVSRAQLRNELEAQRTTQFALRKRLHQEEQARRELEWQLRRTEEEVAEMEGDQQLDAHLQAQTASLKLAHTRLERRSGRAGADCAGTRQVTEALTQEVAQLETSITLLGQKLCEARRALQQMQLHRSLMLRDLSRKQEAVSLEQRSLARRRSLGRAP
uniref:Tektin n=1 Tax=Tetraodon nigroviridis TaxID=99883 RepID=H3DQH8_TETNG